MLLEQLNNDEKVFAVMEGTAPLVPASDPGATGFDSSATYTIDASARDRFLSLAMMLICTNDGFTGLDRLRLPQKINEPVTVYTDGYDAGTEINTEEFADLVPPCQGLIGSSSGQRQARHAPHPRQSVTGITRWTIKRGVCTR